jgi:hypothetical protein
MADSALVSLCSLSPSSLLLSVVMRVLVAGDRHYCNKRQKRIPSEQSRVLDGQAIHSSAFIEGIQTQSAFFFILSWSASTPGHLCSAFHGSNHLTQGFVVRNSEIAPSRLLPVLVAVEGTAALTKMIRRQPARAAKTKNRW